MANTVLKEITIVYNRKIHFTLFEKLDNLLRFILKYEKIIQIQNKFDSVLKLLTLNFDNSFSDTLLIV